LEMNDKATIEDYRKVTGILKTSLDRMHKINDDLLLLTDCTQSTAKFGKLDIESLITEVVEESSAEAKKNEVNLDWHPSGTKMMVAGDTIRLKQAIINLVDNAIKYNRPGGSVALSAWIESGQLAIEVSDSGIGISTEDMPKLFSRFFRVDKSRSRLRGGSGLGLSIVKKIVEDHKGVISVKSVLGKGTSFHILLPLADR
jgi:signal transduction histidine kinase